MSLARIVARQQTGMGLVARQKLPVCISIALEAYANHQDGRPPSHLSPPKLRRPRQRFWPAAFNFVRIVSWRLRACVRLAVPDPPRPKATRCDVM